MKRKNAVKSITGAIATILARYNLRDESQFAAAAEEVAYAFYWENDLGIVHARAADLAHQIQDYLRTAALHHRNVDAEHVVSLCARHSGVKSRLFTHSK
jgi:hypothetical protein